MIPYSDVFLKNKFGYIGVSCKLPFLACATKLKETIVDVSALLSTSQFVFWFFLSFNKLLKPKCQFQQIAELFDLDFGNQSFYVI
jgi:hypothetical protein